MKKVIQLEQTYMRKKTPQFTSGDTLRVHVKIKEGDKERVQVFQGTVIGRRGGGTGATFTVRKMSQGIGVERVFPLHSPNIERIERIKVGSVRRGKLNYLRDLSGKSARIKEQMIESAESAEDFVEETVTEENVVPPEVEDTTETTAEVKTDETAEVKVQTEAKEDKKAESA